ncbi:MAG: 30S ribosomal protein S6 [Nitrospirae bacterium]|nr:30S ribosomal protein S6 [Nitrospirota bacterium]
MNTYESIFIVKPSISDDDVTKTVTKLEGIIKQGGEYLTTENWGKKKLAYEVNKEKKGLYLLFRFRGKGTLVDELERNYRFDDNVIKFMTIQLGKHELEVLEKKAAAKPAEAVKAEETETETE